MSQDKCHQIIHVTIFSVLWAIAHIGHLLRKESAEEPLVWLLLLSCVLLIGRPSSPMRLGLLALAQLFLFVRKMPFTDNHMYIMAFANAGILVVVASVLFRTRSWSDHHTHQMRSYVALVLVVSYSAAAIAKLNTGFFNTSSSCAVLMLYDSLEVFGLERGSLPSVVNTGMPFMVAGTELIISTLLAISRMRVYGVVLAIFFHMSISFSPTATALDFTLLIFAMAYLILPTKCSLYVEYIFNAFDRTVLSNVSRYRSALSVMLLFVVLVALNWRLGTVAGNRSWALLALLALTIAAALLILLVYLSRSKDLKPDTVFTRLKPLQYVLVGLLVFNVATPYLGVKTAGTFTMYSNLDTFDFHSNHFLLPRLPVAGYQDDLVEIKSTSNQRLEYVRKRGLQVTWHELRRVLARDPEASISFVRNGEPYAYERADQIPGLTEVNPVLQKLVAHRPHDHQSRQCLW